MLTGSYRSQSNGNETIIGRGDNHTIHIGPIDNLAPITRYENFGPIARQLSRAFDIGITGGDQGMPAQGLLPLTANIAATYDGNVQRFYQFSPRSSGMIRRSV